MKKLAFMSAIVIASLTACGGGDKDPEETVPPTTSASVTSAPATTTQAAAPTETTTAAQGTPYCTAVREAKEKKTSTDATKAQYAAYVTALQKVIDTSPPAYKATWQNTQNTVIALRDDNFSYEPKSDFKAFTALQDSLRTECRVFW